MQACAGNHGRKDRASLYRLAAKEQAGGSRWLTGLLRACGRIRLAGSVRDFHYELDQLTEFMFVRRP